MFKGLKQTKHKEDGRGQRPAKPETLTGWSCAKAVCGALSIRPSLRRLTTQCTQGTVAGGSLASETAVPPSEIPAEFTWGAAWEWGLKNPSGGSSAAKVQKFSK